MKAQRAVYGDSLLLYTRAFKEFGTVPFVSGFNDVVVIFIRRE
jgi:hypothetical protein